MRSKEGPKDARSELAPYPQRVSCCILFATIKGGQTKKLMRKWYSYYLIPSW